jgi:transposase
VIENGRIVATVRRAEDHHDVEVMDGSGRRLAKGRLPEGVAGMARLHAIVGELVGDDADEVEVLVGIETDRGPWVQALVTAGYTVFAVNPLQAARFRDRLGVSGAKSDAGDAHVLADMVRTHAHELRPVAGDSPQVEAAKVVARTHKTLIWERTRHTRRLRHALRDYFPAALAAFTDLDAADTLELPAKAPTPARAARLTTARISGALTRARRKNVAEKAGQPQRGRLGATGFPARGRSLVPDVQQVGAEQETSVPSNGTGVLRLSQRRFTVISHGPYG